MPLTAAPRVTVSVRTRIVASVLALTAGTLVVSGVVAERIQDLEIRAAMDEDLAADASTFVALAESGDHPGTGEPFEDPRAALRYSLERRLPGPYEGMIGFVDGTLAFVVDEAAVRLDADPDLVAAVAPLTLEVGQRTIRVETPVTDYRAVVTVVGAASDGSLITDAADAQAGGVPVAAEVLAYDETAMLARFDRAFAIYGGVALLSFVLAAAAAWLIAGRLLAPVRVLAQTARSIGRDDLSERIPVKGDDDLAEMTEAVNGMLTRIESAFTSQTRLLDDVSHELRTPITIVRGHLELMDPRDAEDAAEARAVSLDELDRMSRLVDDLLTLAKAERPDFLVTTSVDLAELTGAVTAKARAWGERRWSVDAIAAGQLIGDRHRLTQAWLQLAANAVRFSADGSEIAIGSAVDGPSARLWVRDHGPGIEPELVPHLFDRHAQARRSDGIGLGLAIVDRIATAHEGTVEVDTRVGEGSTFTLVIPLDGPRNGGQAP